MVICFDIDVGIGCSEPGQIALDNGKTPFCPTERPRNSVRESPTPVMHIVIHC